MTGDWRLLWVLLAIPLASCVTDVREGPAPGIRVQDPSVPQAGIRYNSVAIIDKSLQNWDGKVFDPPWAEHISSGPKEENKWSKIAVESTNSRRTPTGTLEVWAVLRNRTDHPLQIEGRTQFFDEAKAPAEGPTAWKRVFLPPQSVATYRELSTKIRDVHHYYIEVREGR